MNFSDFQHGRYNLLGVSVNYPDNKNVTSASFRLNNTVYTVFENADDNGRSHSEEVMEISVETESPILNTIHIPVILNYVDDETHNSLRLISISSGKIIFEVGTNYFDVDDPYFFMEWSPELA